VKIVKIIS